MPSAYNILSPIGRFARVLTEPVPADRCHSLFIGRTATVLAILEAA